MRWWWRAFAARALLGHRRQADLIAELPRNAELRAACGFDPARGTSAVAPNWVFSRFAKKLRRRRHLVNAMFQTMVERLEKERPFIDERAETPAADIAEQAPLGSTVDLPRPGKLDSAAADLRELKARSDRRLQAHLREEVEGKLRAADEKTLRARAERLGAHAGFADTIPYLLKRGPKETDTLYSDVQGIRPDSCDDPVRLVVKRVHRRTATPSGRDDRVKPGEPVRRQGRRSHPTCASPTT